MYEYKAKLLRVVDGDTLDLKVDLGFKTSVEWRFRLKDIDTPETWRPKSENERRHGEKATEFVIKELKNKDIIVRSYKLGAYSRYSCDIFYDGKSLVEELKKNGFEKKDIY